MDGEIAGLISDVEEARGRVLRSIADLSEAQAVFKSAPDSWSCLQVVEHLYLAEISGISKIWQATAELQSGKKWTGETPHRGKAIEQITAETMKPKEVAPPIATPHIGGAADFWRSAFRSLTPVLAELGRCLEGQPLEQIIFPHYLMGPLDGRQRLQFLRWHMDWHIQQISRVKAHPSFPGRSE